MASYDAEGRPAPRLPRRPHASDVRCGPSQARRLRGFWRRCSNGGDVPHDADHELNARHSRCIQKHSAASPTPRRRGRATKAMTYIARAARAIEPLRRCAAFGASRQRWSLHAICRQSVLWGPPDQNHLEAESSSTESVASWLLGLCTTAVLPCFLLWALSTPMAQRGLTETDHSHEQGSRTASP